MSIPKTIEEFREQCLNGCGFEVDPKLMIEWFPKEVPICELQVNKLYLVSIDGMSELMEFIGYGYYNQQLRFIKDDKVIKIPSKAKFVGRLDSKEIEELLGL